MKKAVTQNREANTHIKTAVLALSLNQRVALAKKKIDKEVLTRIHDSFISEARLRLAIVYQAMEDLYLTAGGATGKAMAVVYLYSSNIKELEEMGVETSWVQRILKNMKILNVSDPVPYIEACLTLQHENRKANKATAALLKKYMPLCECVEDQFIDVMIDRDHEAA